MNDLYMKKSVVFTLFLVFVFSNALAQDFSGKWSGILMTGGEKMDNADVVYLDINANNKGKSRLELKDAAEEFAVKSFKIEQNSNKVSIVEDRLMASSRSRYAPECKLIYDLTYNDSTGYLSGTFKSSTCRHQHGRALFFRSDHEVNTKEQPATTHLWKEFFIRNYKKGYPAPEVLKKEQENFKFQPIYFDFDKSEIRPQYHAYLKRMARVLDGIPDLRVKITGHTDIVGDDPYNMSLSERRADAIRDFFKKHGVKPEKLEIEFKGEREPAAPNTTPEGRQDNRRVVFKFI